MLAAAAIVAVLVTPRVASAAPSPSPSLDTVLAKPPSSDFTPLSTAAFRGSFTAHDWAAAGTGAPAAETEASLKQNGFVDGYGMTWTSSTAKRVLFEIVMAFNGGEGAKKTLTALEASDKTDPTFTHANTLSGVDPSYGIHLVDTKKGVYTDAFAFVKGNDLFEVASASPRDDNLTPATTQAKSQYDSAPASTIPADLWPENAALSGASQSDSLTGIIPIALVVILVVVAVVVGVFVRQQAIMNGLIGAPPASDHPAAGASATDEPETDVPEGYAPQASMPEPSAPVAVPALAAQVAPPPSALQGQRVQIPSVHPEDLYAVGAAAVSSLCLAWLVYWQLAPEPGVLGFLLAWLAGFAAMYWLATRRILGRLFAEDRVIAVVITVGAVVMLGPLVLIISFVAYKGFAVITPHFFTQTAQFCGQLDAATCGGVGHAIVGTLEQVGIATLISVPLAVLCAVFLNEIGGPLARPVRLFVDAMSGVPSIVAGLFIYAVWVVGLQRGFSGFAASLALAILMLPTITRTSEVVLRLVPDGLREGSLALGGTEWRTVWQVVLPTARSGLVTAVILGVARAVGETAPLLLTAFGSSVLNADPIHGPQEALPHYVFEYIHFNPGTGPYQRAWAAAAVLTALVLGLFTAGRLISALTSVEARQARAGRRRPSAARRAAELPAQAGA